MRDKLPPIQRLRHRIDTGLLDAEVAFNQLTDSERRWSPFAFLHPDPGERFSTLRVAALAALQGLPLGFLLVAIDAHARHAATGQRLATFLAIVCATVFITNRFTLAYFWNRRAGRLAQDRDRFDKWRSGR
ncbi:MAG TPA: hypothetical protein VH062_15375 [Polyangiaceae bacterium]|jgi:hypothetical protein|nr:hypothetical protein [Polyangiaceae bacterium]